MKPFSDLLFPKPKFFMPQRARMAAVGVQNGHRYWRSYKTNSTVGGGSHKELRVEDSEGSVTINSSMLSHSGLVIWDAVKVVDGSTSITCFHTDTSGVGSYCKIDFGAGNNKKLTKWEYYADAYATYCYWNIEYSDDDSSWTSVYTGLAIGAGGWHTATW
ncbi:MAG TPA: hypothetical protein QF468_06570 [Nitrospinota bacterium]|nr:hypothetical protein [Nitrospinota bacterium]